MSGTPPAGLPRPVQQARAGRRTVLWVAFGTVALSFAVLVFLGAAAIFLNGARADVLEFKDLPNSVPLCDNFEPSRLLRFQVTDPQGNRHTAYHIEGGCPVAPVVLNDKYIAVMKDLGWTVHDQGDGNLVAYAYERHEDLIASIDVDGDNPNQSRLQLDIHTNADIPKDFPSPSPS